ncbi:23S rRNA (adenine(2503)-C(2))-methyltransferase RlmN [Candidatus Fermentibacteria bacterium]|nr:23S rRNA (adenine(2503)-C(2))-methyltransferase RlmN [Candidatus Fermentibacteria bacterium]
MKEGGGGKPLRIASLTRERLSEWMVEDLGLRSFRADQLFSWMHGRRVRNFGEMTDLAKGLRAELESRSILVNSLRPTESQYSSDGTTKYVLGLPDGTVVESVLIPDPPRLTACLSSQVGCRMGCRFCQTGLTGFVRDLLADEIVSQLYSMQELSGRRITNVVLMGMGEPLDNIEATLSALSIINDDRGICIGCRKITVSTVGVVPGIYRLAESGSQYGLALSLHSAVESVRRSLVPASGRWPLPEVRQALSDYASVTGRRVTLEYCILKGVNDGVDQAQALAEFASGIPCKINLLAYNPVQGLDYRTPSDSGVARFAQYLYPRCPAVTVRRSRGTEVSAACGQLGTSLSGGGGS